MRDKEYMTEILEFDADVQRDIFGSKDHYVRKIEKDLNVGVIARDGVIKVTGDETAVRKAVGILENLAGLSKARTRRSPACWRILTERSSAILSAANL